MTNERTDRPQPGQAFFAVQLFDRAGYYSSVVAVTEADVKQKTAQRTAKLTVLVACTVPFAGRWSGSTPDVSAPPEVKEAVRALEHEGRDE